MNNLQEAKYTFREITWNSVYQPSFDQGPVRAFNFGYQWYRVFWYEGNKAVAIYHLFHEKGTGQLKEVLMHLLEVFDKDGRYLVKPTYRNIGRIMQQIIEVRIIPLYQD